MTLIFKEPETFTTPDGGEYVILPVQVDDMPILFSIINKKEKLSKKKKQEDKDGVAFIKECGTDLKKLINKTIINTKTGESLPAKYQQPGNVIDLMGRIMKATMPDNEEEPNKDSGTPLEQKPNK